MRQWGKAKESIFSLLFRHMKSAEPLPEVMQYDFRIVRTRLNEYFMCVLKPLEPKSENQRPVFSGESKRRGAGIIALDPGVRTFMTGYDPSGMVYEWGAKDLNRIYRLCHALDDLQSRWSQKDVRHRKRYKLRKAACRIRKKIRNLVYDLHKRLAKWLCENYETVLLPSFETRKMLRKGQRRIGNKTARAMATWSHYRFKQRLLNKSREYPWCQVFIVNESYTSKTCGRCGHIHNGLGGCKEFCCPVCCFEIDRDVNGARNILLRFLTVYTTVIEQRVDSSVLSLDS